MERKNVRLIYLILNFREFAYTMYGLHLCEAQTHKLPIVDQKNTLMFMYINAISKFNLHTSLTGSVNLN